MVAERAGVAERWSLWLARSPSGSLRRRGIWRLFAAIRRDPCVLGRRIHALWGGDATARQLATELVAAHFEVPRAWPDRRRRPTGLTRAESTVEAYTMLRLAVQRCLDDAARQRLVELLDASDASVAGAAAHLCAASDVPALRQEVARRIPDRLEADSDARERDRRPSTAFVIAASRARITEAVGGLELALLKSDFDWKHVIPPALEALGTRDAFTALAGWHARKFDGHRTWVEAVELRERIFAEHGHASFPYTADDPSSGARLLGLEASLEGPDAAVLPTLMAALVDDEQTIRVYAASQIATRRLDGALSGLRDRLNEVSGIGRERRTLVAAAYLLGAEELEGEVRRFKEREAQAEARQRARYDAIVKQIGARSSRPKCSLDLEDVLDLFW